MNKKMEIKLIFSLFLFFFFEAQSLFSQSSISISNLEPYEIIVDKQPDSTYNNALNKELDNLNQNNYMINIESDSTYKNENIVNKKLESSNKENAIRGFYQIYKSNEKALKYERDLLWHTSLDTFKKRRNGAPLNKSFREELLNEIKDTKKRTPYYNVLYYIFCIPYEKINNLELKPMFKIASNYALVDVPLYNILLQFVEEDYFNAEKFENDFLKSKIADSNLLIDFFDLKLIDDPVSIVPSKINNLPLSEKQKISNVISNYVKQSIQTNFNQYALQDVSKKVIKSIYLEHGNDLFYLPSNQDREMTGSFKFEFTTDLFKMRVINRFQNIKKLGYQSIFIGGEGYTPFIRYNVNNIDFSASDKLLGLDKTIQPNGKYNSIFTNQILAPVVDTIQKIVDRPFSSFQYLGRAKYRIGINGKWRAIGIFKFGQMGKNSGRDMQALIHKDINPSIKVLNWDNQIAFPGRLAIQASNRQDFAINPYNWKSINPYFISEGAIGTYQTYGMVGFGISNHNFKSQSGQREIKNNSRSPFKNFMIGSEIFFKHYVHNSAIEGLGWTKTLANTAFSDATAQGYILTDKETIKRNILNWNTKISYRAKNVTINYELFVYSREFDKLTKLLKTNSQQIELRDYLNNVKFISQIPGNLSEDNLALAKNLLLNKFLNNPEIFNGIRPPRFHKYGTVSFNFYFD